MSALPTGWRSSVLGDVTKVRKEKSDPRQLPNLPFIGLEEVEAHTGRIISTQNTSALKSAVSLFAEGDVLYGRLRPYLNKVAIPDFAGAASAEFIVFPRSKILEPRYLQWVLMSSDFLSFTALKSTGDRPRVSYESISSYEFPVPPIGEQRRIVAKIHSLFTKSRRSRDHLGHIPRLVEKYKQAILSAAFGGALTREWRETHGETSAWRSIATDEIIRDIVAGKNLRCEERPPADHERGVLKVSAVTWGTFDPKATKTLPATFIPPKHTRVQAGDFLLSRANTLELVGAVVIVQKTPSNLFLSDKILRLEMAEECKPWMLWFLRSPDGRAAIEKSATGNQLSMRNLSQTALREIEVPWPSAKEREVILRCIETAFTWIDRLAAEAISARKLVDHLDQSILAKAFRGELVPQDPSDEPASILLERIRAERAAAQGAVRRGPPSWRASPHHRIARCSPDGR